MGGGMLGPIIVFMWPAFMVGALVEGKGGGAGASISKMLFYFFFVMVFVSSAAGIVGFEYSPPAGTFEKDCEKLEGPVATYWMGKIKAKDANGAFSDQDGAKIQYRLARWGLLAESMKMLVQGRTDVEKKRSETQNILAVKALYFDMMRKGAARSKPQGPLHEVAYAIPEIAETPVDDPIEVGKKWARDLKGKVTTDASFFEPQKWDGILLEYLRKPP